jgi:hypothetical protein
MRPTEDSARVFYVIKTIKLLSSVDCEVITFTSI